jgi:hypothetical protein
MPIRQRTFAPRLLDAGGLLRPADYSSLDDLVDEASVWIASEGLDVVNVETLLLETTASRPPELAQNGHIDWDTGLNGIYQYVRVWYRAG